MEQRAVAVERPWQRVKLVFWTIVWPRRWRIVGTVSAYFLMRLCEFAPEGWPFTLCELVHRLLKVFGA